MTGSVDDDGMPPEIARLWRVERRRTKEQYDRAMKLISRVYPDQPDENNLKSLNLVYCQLALRWASIATLFGFPGAIVMGSNASPVAAWILIGIAIPFFLMNVRRGVQAWRIYPHLINSGWRRARSLSIRHE